MGTLRAIRLIRIIESWKKLLLQLDSIHLCTFAEEQSLNEISAMSQFIDGGTYNSTEHDKTVSITAAASVFLLREFKKFPAGMMAVTGKVEFPDTFHEINDLPFSINMTFVVPRNLTETSYKDTCVILTGPPWLLPLSRRTNVCIPSSINRTITHVGSLIPFKQNDASVSCRNGSSIRLSYNNQSDDEFYLSKEERWNIYIRLIHTSYFLLIVAVTFMCYSVIRGRIYTSVVKVDKIPLNL